MDFEKIYRKLQSEIDDEAKTNKNPNEGLIYQVQLQAARQAVLALKLYHEALQENSQ
jgi:hypothetical protein